MRMSTRQSGGWLDQAIAALGNLFHRMSAASDEFIGTWLGLED